MNAPLSEWDDVADDEDWLSHLKFEIEPIVLPLPDSSYRAPRLNYADALLLYDFHKDHLGFASIDTTLDQGFVCQLCRVEVFDRCWL